MDSVMFEPTILASILKNLCASVAAVLRFETVPFKFTKDPGIAVTGVVTEPIVKSGIIKEIAVVAAFFSQCAWSIKRISKESKAFSIQALGVGELRIVSQVLDIKVLLGVEVSLVMGFR